MGDGKYGARDAETKIWNGMVGELVYGVSFKNTHSIIVMFILALVQCSSEAEAEYGSFRCEF